MNLIRNLAGFIIILSLLPISTLAFRYTTDLPFDYTSISDETALCQLREMMLISYDLDYSRDILRFRFKNKECSLSQVNDKLILHPGTQIFLADLDDLHFEDRNGVIYVCYQRGKEAFQRAILSRRGFYLDSFSDCDVHLDVSDSGQERSDTEGE